MKASISTHAGLIHMKHPALESNDYRSYKLLQRRRGDGMRRLIPFIAIAMVLSASAPLFAPGMDGIHQQRRSLQGQVSRSTENRGEGLQISSSSPFVALTLRSLTNARGDFLLTTFP